MNVKKAGSLLLNYSPGLLILLFSLFALFSAVKLIEKNEALSDFYIQNIAISGQSQTGLIERQDDIIKDETRLYWSIWIMGFSGFLLVLLNTDKLRRISKANKEKATTLELLERQLAEIQKVEDDKYALQKQLYQAQKLEAIGRLAGGIAHDFNNILAAMNGYAEFLTDDLKPGTAQHGFANSIIKAGAQARDLVDKILTFSRRENSDIRYMDIKIPLEETLGMLKASLPKTIKVETYIEKNPVNILGNATQVSQVVMNLCVNAKDAMKNERGILEIGLEALKSDDLTRYDMIKTMDKEDIDRDAAPPIILSYVNKNHTCLILGTLEKEQNYAVLSVKDNGTGMTRRVMEHIFEPFFTTKSVDEGTGLGLAMVHGVVTSHRGCMVINSILGQGTRFEMLFPLAGPEENQQMQENAKTNLTDGQGKILLVEDQEDVRAMMCNMLERMGFETESCTNGHEAEEIITEHPDYFDVVLTDHNMPEMTGLELAERIGKRYPKLPFVILSGYNKDKIGDNMKDHGSIKAVLRKPADRETLMKTLSSVIADQVKAA